MNNLPDRIWCDFDEETMDRGFFSDEHFAGDVEYLRSDTLPSRDELHQLVIDWMNADIERPFKEDCLALADVILARIKGENHD